VSIYVTGTGCQSQIICKGKRDNKNSLRPECKMNSEHV